MTFKQVRLDLARSQTFWIAVGLVVLMVVGHPAGSKGAGQKSTDLERLIGRWLRPDGGYVIEIMNFDNDGRLQVAYFNPRPVNVSQAKIIQQNPEFKIFIELHDVGYPKAAYALTYDMDRDRLVGQYYQPAVGQTFQVEFVRMP